MTATLLITGFGPFPAAPENPSGFLVERLAADADLRRGSRIDLAFAVLPTEWERIAPNFAALIEQHRPRFALHFGYAAEAPGFQLEASAYNECCGRIDGCGATRLPGPISDDARSRRDTPLPLAAIRRRLARSRLPAVRSADPGRYLCNNLYFRSLDTGLAALFVHIPALATPDGVMPGSHLGAPPLEVGLALAGARLLVAAIEDVALDLDGEHFF